MIDSVEISNQDLNLCTAAAKNERRLSRGADSEA